MVLQLYLVGLYLQYLFKLNHPLLNQAWLCAMLLVCAGNITSKVKLRLPLLWLLLGLSASFAPVLLGVIVAVRPHPLYSAQYLIPLAGMLLGNSLNANIIALQHFFGELQQRRSEYEAALALGATPRVAARPFVRSVIQRAMAHSLASMATMGLVSLPGMMTGQILGGAAPLMAIKYQILIIVAIFVMLLLSVSTTLCLMVWRCLGPSGRVLVA